MPNIIHSFLYIQVSAWQRSIITGVWRISMIYIINIIHNEFMLYTSQICYSIIGTEEAFSRNTEKSKREPLKYVLCTQILVIT